jgi:hypothetical protein
MFEKKETELNSAHRNSELFRLTVERPASKIHCECSIVDVKRDYVTWAQR